MEEKQKAVIAGADLQGVNDFNYSMEELMNLAEACDIEVVGEISQKLDRINNVSYFGKGKIDEIKELMEATEAECVIFNDELSPSQIRNLEDRLSCVILDRTTLILEIFARRAKTKEAQMQVEIAKLQYSLPRLAGLRASLGRQGGGAGLTNRGAGETKLELDRRKIETRIHVLHKELEALVAQRKSQRKQREKNEIPVIALVGYTNAGKSTLMNQLLQQYDLLNPKYVFEKDMLFATLETSVRRIKLPDKKEFLLTDTVGFISKLPHYLVKAFRSTLEEVTEADLLIHVIDVANKNYEQQIEVTNHTLQEIGVKEIPMIYVYNKIDMVEAITDLKDDALRISAKQNIGIDVLMEAIKSEIFGSYVTCVMHIPFHKGDIVAYLNQYSKVQEVSYEYDGTKITAEIKLEDYNRYKEYVVS